jgi:pyruvate carboxylase
LFVEKLVDRPRHIEVQILADAHGNAVHLHERDCSVQLRHQKVVEVAPAPALDEALRARILADAIKLVRAAEYVNAGTVEFLVTPETGEYFFIECNPRIQVEHTVTEQVTGVDLVEAQFHIAAGATLASIGLGDQDAVGAPRGFAVQARVVARGAGVMGAYKEPSGPGVRVDACGYLGYAPPPQFDPLFAKVIGSSSSAATFESAVDRTLRALDEFHVAGLPTNLGQLRAILSHPVVRAGDARTTLLADEPELMGDSRDATNSANGAALALLEQQANAVGGNAGRRGAANASVASPASLLPALPMEAGQRAVECPMDGAVVEVPVGEGASVAAGETVLVISAMKMETLVTAPCAGVVSAVQPLVVGDSVSVGQVVAVVTPSEDATEQSLSAESGAQQTASQQNWTPVLDEISA